MSLNFQRDYSWIIAYSSDVMAEKVAKTNSSVTSRYFYDGQMPTEIAESSASGTVLTQNETGGRGIERITRGSTVVYPVYDAHGNQVGDISKNGTGYLLNDLRTFDAWGSVRSGNGSGDPKQGYCASLGRLKDDESGLTYMRARYYEPTTGRFVSEDPARDGRNWQIFCRNEPVLNTDATGKFLDIIMTMFMDYMLENQNASAQLACKHFAKEKIESIMAEKTGELVGALMALEIDSILMEPNGYMYLGSSKGGPRIGIDWGDYGVAAHDGPHIDLLDDAVQKGKKLGYGSKIKLFVEGVWKGLSQNL